MHTNACYICMNTNPWPNNSYQKKKKIEWEWESKIHNKIRLLLSNYNSKLREAQSNSITYINSGRIKFKIFSTLQVFKCSSGYLSIAKRKLLYFIHQLPFISFGHHNWLTDWDKIIGEMHEKNIDRMIEKWNFWY